MDFFLFFVQVVGLDWAELCALCWGIALVGSCKVGHR